jgi:hypothetical protein
MRKEEKGKEANLREANARGTNVSSISHAEVSKGSSEASPVHLARLLTQLLMEKQNQGFVLSKSNPLDFNSPLINFASNQRLSNFCQNKNNWVIDSGKTDHMTWDKNILKDYQNSKEFQHVTIANGNKVKFMVKALHKYFLRM